MATTINPQVSQVTPATSSEAPSIGANPNSSPAISSPAAAPDLRKFNALTSTRSSGPRGILGRPVVGNVGEINAGGVRGTPGDLVERVLEHEPPLGLLNEALRP
jgi:hypothetical protein